MIYASNGWLQSIHIFRHSFTLSITDHDRPTCSHQTPPFGKTTNISTTTVPTCFASGAAIWEDALDALYGRLPNWGRLVRTGRTVVVVVAGGGTVVVVCSKPKARDQLPYKLEPARAQS